MPSPPMRRGRPRRGLALLLSLLAVADRTRTTRANPASKPYIAFRTDPHDQDTFVDHALELAPDPTFSKVVSWKEASEDPRCRIRFSLGIGKRVHGDWNAPIVAPPVVYPALPGAGPGRQVLLNHYEHLDLLTPSSVLSSSVISSSSSSGPASRAASGGTGGGKQTLAAISRASSSSGASSAAVKEVLLQGPEYPLLLEGSTFWAAPLVADVDGDGRPEAILVDSEGGVFVVGLSSTTTSPSPQKGPSSAGKRRRTFQSAQVPRLFVRREWVEKRVQHATGGNGSVPQVLEHSEAGAAPDDPYHSYFEYYHVAAPEQQDLLRAVSANWWDLESHDRQKWRERRHRRQQRPKDHQSPQGAAGEPDNGTAKAEEAEQRPLVREQVPPPPVDDFVGDDLEYMLAKEREAEQRGIVPEDDDDVDADLRQGVVQRRRLQEEEQHREQQDHHQENEQQREQEQRHIDERPQGEQRQVQDPAAATDSAHHPPHHDRSSEERPNPPGGDASSRNEKLEERGLYYDDLEPDREIPDVDRGRAGDDIANDVAARDDPEYGMKYDDYYRRGYGGLDDEYRGRNDRHRDYYDAKHYIRVPPHVLCTPVLAELPKLYTNTDEKEDILYLAVSYFLDEDEYEGLTGYKRFAETDRGDETEASRGMYVASAIMAYVLGDSPRWTGQTHLDLSTDYTAPENLTVVGALPIRADPTKMGAFALGSPTVADVDGDGNMEVLLGTSMGIVYAFDARQMYKKAKFPIQMPYPVESKILVEDVRGDTNLEIFVADIGGNLICFSHEANPLWHRNLATSVGLRSENVKGASPMAMGDLNGDGVMDLTMAVLINGRSFLFALNAATGEDLPNFPIELDPSYYPKLSSENVHKKLSQPLLVDLHQDQTFLSDYLRRNGTAYVPRKAKSPVPGQALGLHIVYPQSQYLLIIEAGSGCSHVIQIGDPISAMVQVDDVHGTNRLDLLVTTEAGDVITLESPSPFHPLNTWNKGELRGRMNGHAHGYSASQGIFVHEVSRQYIDVFGVYVPITFEIFDNRPNIANEPEKRQYTVEVRDGTSSKRVLFRTKYEEPGVYTERVFVRFGPGYYTLHVVLLTSHGLLYEDTFHIGYNVRFMNGFGILLWLPLLAASATILLCGAKKSNWDEDDGDSDRDNHTMGILGRSLPS